MNDKSSQLGYSLIEVMIAVAILMMAIVAPMTVAVKSIQSSRYTLEQDTAIFLAQEPISILEMIRNHHALVGVKAAIDGTPDPGLFWDWTDIDAISGGECKTVTDGCNFDVSDLSDFTDDDLITLNDGITRCDNDGKCTLYFVDGADIHRSPYGLKSSAGYETPFDRRVYLDLIDHDDEPDELQVRVDVKWQSNFLGDERVISISSSIFNMYEAL